MKKIFTLFALLMLGIGAQAQVYVPGERVSTIEENTKYFIFNTTYTPDGAPYDKRWGFVFYDGEVKTYGGAVPEEFNTNDANYLFTFSNNGDETWTLSSVGQEMEVGYTFTFTPWMEADESIKGNAQVRNDDGTFTENANISEENKVWVISNGEGDRPYWNGNNWTTVGANSFALWSNAHPYAIYTVIEKYTVTVLYNLYDPDGSFIKSAEVEQLPNSAVSIPTELTEGNGYSPLGYDFVASMETIGETACEIDVNITLKEGVVTDLANLSNNKAYMLTTERGSLGSNGTQMVSTNGTEYEASNFAIVNYEDNYYLWSVADGKWVSSNTQPTLTDDLTEVEPLLFDTNDESENPLDLPLYFIGMGEKGVNVSNYTSGIVVNTWVERDPGNKYIIKENGEFDPTNAITALDVYFHPEYKITYIVNDENGQELFRSEPVGIAKGTNVTTLPNAYQKSLFYDYNTIDVTISEVETEVEFTATQKEDGLFKFTADTSAPIWYNLTLKNGFYPTYEAEGDPNVTLPNYLEDDATTQWAFIGNPYVGFKIVNKAAGTDLFLCSDSAVEDGDNGGNTQAVLAEEGSRAFNVWTIEASSHYTNGFFIRNPENHALNQRSTYSLAYWTGGADAGSTFTATKILSNDEKLAEAQHLLEELTAGANDVKIGYPTEQALAMFKSELDNIADQYGMGILSDEDFNTMLNAALEEVKSIANTEYTPRTDVYYTITNPRGSVVYDPEHAEDLDGNGNEFLWYTKSLDKENANHQWGFYEKEGNYYLYNVGKKQFASVSTSNPEVSGKSFFSDGCWIFANIPAKVKLDAGFEGEEWVATPAARIQGTVSIEDEFGDSYENDFTMSISTSYTGPVITYYAVNDGGVPMTFALATSTQDEEVTAAIEELLDPNGIETIDNSQSSINNGAIYNLQGQRVVKAQKGVFIQNGKKIVVK